MKVVSRGNFPGQSGNETFQATWKHSRPTGNISGHLNTCLLMKVVNGNCLLMKVVNENCLLIKDVHWWKLCIDESCLLMQVVYWWKLSIDESYLLMKVVYWWKFSIDESCLLMKLSINEIINESCVLTRIIMAIEVIDCDVSPVAMFFLNLHYIHM